MNELELEPLGERVVIFEPLNDAPPEEPSCLLWPLWLVISQHCPAELHGPAAAWALRRDWGLIGLLLYDSGVPLFCTPSLRRAFVRTWYTAWPRLLELGAIFVVNGSERRLTLPGLHRRIGGVTTLTRCLAEYFDQEAVHAALCTDAGPAALIDAEGNAIDAAQLRKDRRD